ncbi:MAG: metallophosphoesterase family protein, partial [Promethearchaeota archaeon]
TATIVYPRFGCAIQGPVAPGPGHNTSIYLDGTITFWVAPDPAEVPIPTAWLDKSNWDVALSPSVMPTANCTPLEIEKIYIDDNPLVLFGGNLDSNPVIPSALAIECKVPADVSPVLYNLAMGFKTEITVERQARGEIDLIPRVGSWRGPRQFLSSGKEPFLLTERNVVSIPWRYDARTFSSELLTPDDDPIKPFTVMHVTDTHYFQYEDSWLGNNSLWENDTQVIAPDIIVLSGDVMERNDKEELDGAYQYEMAYDRLTSLNLPFVIVSGNHDNYNLGPWKHYFGPLFSTTTFDHLKIVGIDSTLPINTGILNWISERSTPVVHGGPVLLTCHYNIDPSYFSSGWWGIANLMMRKNLTGILVGHTHVDLVGSVPKLMNAIIENMDAIGSGDLNRVENVLTDVLETSNETTGYLESISEPQILMTRTAAKTGGVAVPVEGFNMSELRYSGYRLLRIKDDLVYNYTYDVDGDGTRDPQFSYPVGLFKVDYQLDTGLGQDPNANVTWILNNDGNEDLRAARAVFIVPNPPSGTSWDLIQENQTSGAYIRAIIKNGTHWWIDARVSSPAQSQTRLVLHPRSF